MILDFHTHIFPPTMIQRRTQYLARDATLATLFAGPKAPMVTAQELLAAMDEAGVDMAVTLGIGWNSQELARLANDYLLDRLRSVHHRSPSFSILNSACPILNWSTTDPYMYDNSGVNYIRFYLASYMADIKVDQKPTPRPLSKLVITQSRPLYVICRKFEESRELDLIKTLVSHRLQASGKTDSDSVPQQGSLRR